MFCGLFINYVRHNQWQGRDKQGQGRDKAGKRNKKKKGIFGASLEVRELLQNLSLFGKAAFTHKLTLQPCYLVAPKWRWHIYFWLHQNMSLIREVCDSLGTDWLSLSGRNLWATGRVNLSSVKGGLMRFHLLLLEGNAIFPKTPPKAGCAVNLIFGNIRSRNGQV